jgi:hypothetical protein
LCGSIHHLPFYLCEYVIYPTATIKELGLQHGQATKAKRENRSRGETRRQVKALQEDTASREPKSDLEANL